MVAISRLFFTGILFKYAYSTTACQNDDLYRYKGDPQKTCKWIRFKKEYREIYCQDPEVHQFCPQACGECCEDDSAYQVEAPLKDNIKCSWIAQLKKRQNKICNAFRNGEIVRDRCPKACRWCVDFVPYTTEPSYVPSGNPSKVYCISTWNNCLIR